MASNIDASWRNMEISGCDGTFGEAHRNLVFGKPVMSAQEMAEVMDTYVTGSVVVPPVEQLRKLHEILLEAITLARTGQAMMLDRVSNLLPAAMARYLNGDDVAVWSRETEFHSRLFEVMWTLVELAVVMLSNQVKFLVETPSDNSTRSMCGVTLKVLEALSAAFDSRSRYFELRKEKGTRREALVCCWRLESALKAPGFFVRVSGVVNGQTHYFCSKNGVNHDGEACECCRPPPEADAVLVILSWLLANTTFGSGYEYMMRFLIPPRQFSLVTVELLLRPFVQLLRICSVGSTTWNMLIQHVEISSTTDFQRLCVNVCSGMAKCVESTLFWSYFKTVYKNDLTPSDVLGHLRMITTWSIFHYGRMELKVVRESLSKLQEKMWDMLLDAKRFSMACTSVSAAMEANSFLPDSEDVTLDLNWMERINVISRILKHPVDIRSLQKVIQFVTMIGKKGLVLPEVDFLEISEEILFSDSTFDQSAVNPEGQKFAAILGCLDLSGYSIKTLYRILKWLEMEHQASGVDGEKVFSILSKLLVRDKRGKLENYFFTVLRKHAANIPDRALVSSLVSKIANYYTSKEVVEDLKTSLKTSEDQEKLLQHCSDVMDNDSRSFSSNMAGTLTATEAYVQKITSWKVKEIDFLLSSSSNLSSVLETPFPFICSQSAKECLDRVVLARRLVSNLNPGGSNTCESIVTSAMAPEFQTLRALQEETLLHSQHLQQVEELSEKHLKAYDAMKQKQHDEILKFFQTCQQEKESAVIDALYKKEKIMARVRNAGDARLPFEDTPTRLFIAAQASLQEVRSKHEESLERLPNSDCVVCFSEFSSIRKRACMDPCGHAGACVKCATREWKRTKTCPMCKSGIDKPVSVPSKLFF